AAQAQGCPPPRRDLRLFCVASGTARRVFRPFDAGAFRPRIRRPGASRARVLAPTDTRQLEVDVREHQGPLPREPAARVPGELRFVSGRSALESADGCNRPPRRADLWAGGSEEDRTRRRFRQANLRGPARFVSIDDSEVMKFSQNGVAPYPEQAGVMEMGGRDWKDEQHMVTESVIRAFYAYYRRVMEI